MNILACGALANELVALKQLNHWHEWKIVCLPAHYHQTPQKIPAAVKAAIKKIRQQNSDEIFVAYADCGTGGRLDTVLKEAGVNRLPGAHCYEFFAGGQAFAALQDAEIGSFYLTDFLVSHFETYVWRMLGLDRKPELMEMYFGNYKKLVYLAQTESELRLAQARGHANTLGLAFEYCFTGYGELGDKLAGLAPVKVAEPCLI